MSIINDFHNICNKLADTVNKQLFESRRNKYWVGDEIGGICDFEDTDFLTPEEMVLIIENKLTYEQYAAWRDANIEYGLTKGYINLKSWLLGCRHDLLPDKSLENKWISVKEALPPFDLDVLVCDISKPDDMIYCHRSNNPLVKVGKDNWCLYIEDYNITHWMNVTTNGIENNDKH